MSGKLKLYYGPSLLARRELFWELLQGGRPALYVIPNSLLKRKLEERFLKEGRGSGLPERTLLTWWEVLLHLARPLVGSRMVIGEARKRRLLSQLLEGERMGSLPPSGLTSLARVLSLFKRRFPDEPFWMELYKESLGREGERLHRLLPAYQAALQERCWLDQDDLVRLVHEGLLTGRIRFRSTFPQIDRLLLEGVEPQDRVEAGILRLIIREVEETAWAVDVSGIQASPSQRPALQLCRELAGQLRAEWVHCPALTRPELVLSGFPSREAEVRQAAGEVRRLLDGGLLQPEEILILAPEPLLYLDPLREEFESWGLSWSWVDPIPLGKSKAIRLLLTYLQLMVGDFQLEDLLELTGSPLWNPDLLDSRERHLLMEWSAELGLEGGYRRWKEAFLRQPLREIGGEKLLRLLDKLYLDPAVRMTWLGWAVELVAKSRSLLRLPCTAAMAFENQALRSFWDIFEDYAQLNPRRELELRELLELLRGDVAQASVTPRPAEGTVLVGGPNAAAHLSSEVAFWLGLCEGHKSLVSFPGEPLGSGTAQIHSAPLWEMHRRESQARFELIAGSVRRRLYCFWPEHFGGRSRSRSYLLEGRGPEGSLRAHSLPLDPQRQAVRHRNLSRGRKVLRWRESDRFSPFEGVWRQERLLQGLRRRFFHSGIRLSPSQLEAFQRCGFRYLAERILGLKAVPSPAVEVDSREWGELLHRILFRFVSETREEEKGEISRSTWLAEKKERMWQIAREELEASPSFRKFRQTVFWQHQEKRLLGGLQGEGTGLLVRFLELEWERRGSYQAVALEEKLGPYPLLDGEAARKAGLPGPLWLEGTVDRLDWDRERRSLLLIDYKTGSGDPKRSLHHGWGLQLPLYLWAAAQSRGEGDIQAAFYRITLPLRVELQNLLLPYDRLVEYYRKRAVRLAAQLSAGRFPWSLLTPKDAGCAACPFRDACRRDPVKAARLRNSGRYPVAEKIVQRGAWVGPEREPARESTAPVGSTP